MLTKGKNYNQLYDDLYSIRSEHTSIWQDISDYVGITVDEDYFESPNSRSPNDPLDTDVEDPTAALSVIQAGDYLDGIIWGTGEEALTLEPSDWVLQQQDMSQLKEYFEFRTNQLLANMNHSDAGFSTARKPYFYGQMAFGTSGIGVWKNADFPNKEENPYFFRGYGVDNMLIGEGKNGRINTIFLIYHWRVSRIMQEFDFDEKVIPDCICKEFAAGNYNKYYTLVQGIAPRQDFLPHLMGKRGTQYEGVWFLDQNKQEIFYEEDFRRLPVGVARAIKVNGETWGRSSGSLLISSIKATNYMLSQAIETIEKINDPAMGTWNNALFGDSILDTGAGTLTAFNDQMRGDKGLPPVFKLYDTGDPTALVSFLLPYLNDKITTGFKVDMLLDFSSAKDMTATESLQRYAIRGKSLAGVIGQQKSEMLDVVVDRCIQIEDDNGLAGVDPTDEAQVKAKRQINRSDMIIPEAVLAAMKAGKRWYKVRYNNELERMSKTEGLERIIQLVNGLTMLAAVNPSILEAVKWYDIYKDMNEALGVSYIVDEDEFKATIAQQAELQKQAMMLQAGQAGADIQSKMSKSNKDEADANR